MIRSATAPPGPRTRLPSERGSPPNAGAYGIVELPSRAPPDLSRLELESDRRKGDRTMKRSRFSEEQIIAILREQEAGASPADLCRKYGHERRSGQYRDFAFCDLADRALGFFQDIGTSRRIATSAAAAANWVAMARPSPLLPPIHARHLQRNSRMTARKTSRRSWWTQWPAPSTETTFAVRKCRARPSSRGLDAQLSLP